MMNKTQGMVSLDSLYKLCKARPHGIPHGRKQKIHPFWTEVDSLVQDIELSAGFYLWGRYEPSGLWRNIYLGKAGFGKTANLRSRIREELKDERCFLWRVVLSEKRILINGRGLYPIMWREYEKHWKRSLKKAMTTHINWVSVPDLGNRDVKRVESDLIEALNPSSNVQRVQPPQRLQKDTQKIFARLRCVIHSHRKSRYRLRLM